MRWKYAALTCFLSPQKWDEMNEKSGKANPSQNCSSFNSNNAWERSRSIRIIKYVGWYSKNGSACIRIIKYIGCIFEYVDYAHINEDGPGIAKVKQEKAWFVVTKKINIRVKLKL